MERNTSCLLHRFEFQRNYINFNRNENSSPYNILISLNFVPSQWLNIHLLFSTSATMFWII